MDLGNDGPDDRPRPRRQGLDRGERLTELLKQNQFVPVPIEEQVCIIHTGSSGAVDAVPIALLGKFERELLEFLRAGHEDLLSRIRETKKLDDDDQAELDAAIVDFAANAFSERAVIEAG